MTRLVTVVVLALALVGCRADNAPGETVTSGGVPGFPQAIKYVHDDAHGVGCWYYVGESTGSMSCLPDAEYQP